MPPGQPHDGSMRTGRAAPWGVALVAVVGGCIGDHEAPQIVHFTPDDDLDARGLGLVSVAVEYTDESDVTTQVLVDGDDVGLASPQCGEHSCIADFTLPTDGYTPGYHELSLLLRDDAGNHTASEVHEVWLDDVLEVTAMRVTNIVDDAGTLEIEVYAFDETDQLIGCAGSRHGLAGVDASDTDYTVEADLIDMQSISFATRDVGAKKFRLEVWEDDDDPVCPVVPDPLYNDVLGKSPLRSVDEWRALTGPESFGQVVKLETAWVRDLTMRYVDPGDPDPPPDPIIDWGNGGGGGCSSTRGGGLVLALAALGLVTRSRRARR